MKIYYNVQRIDGIKVSCGKMIVILNVGKSSNESNDGFKSNEWNCRSKTISKSNALIADEVILISITSELHYTHSLNNNPSVSTAI